MSDIENPQAEPDRARDRPSRVDDAAGLVALLDLERIEVNLFRGVSPRQGRDRIFGGQVLAQALTAAQRTVEDETRIAHSLHGYFLRIGDPTTPILYEVDRIRDGRSFTTRRVVAIQRGEAIFNMAVSFQVPEEGLAHQLDGEIPSEVEGEIYEDALVRAAAAAGFEFGRDDRRFALPVEVRTPGGLHMLDEATRPAEMHCWIRARGALPDEDRIHQCVAAYASDLTILVPALYPHPVGVMSAGVQTASLDHAMWFHRPLRIDDWLLFVHESPVSARNRGFGTSRIYTRSGELVASCAQEGLMRRRPPADAQPT